MNRRGVKQAVFVVATILLGVTVLAARAAAQVEPPDRKYLYFEDKTAKKEARKRREAIRKKQRQVAKEAQNKGLPFDINATSIDYDSSAKVIRGEGGVIIGYGSSIIEAERGEVSVENKQAELSGDVRITDLAGNLAAESVNINLNDSTGTLVAPDINFEEGDYRLTAAAGRKTGPDDYELDEALMTTCQCPEEGCTIPWQLAADEAKITRDGYGQAWGAYLRAYETPVFYVPYLFFPAKTSRQSGFLPANIGSSGTTGFTLALPFFWAIDKSTDATITPLIETEARVGVGLELRKLFSRESSLEMGGLYVNESLRGDDALGTSTAGLSDPSIDENRFGGYINGNSAATVFDEEAQLILSGRYVSDDLFLRELDPSEEIGVYNTRYVTSELIARMPVADSFVFEAGAEFNQAMVENDDYVFQRAPSLSLSGLHSWRPFQNPYGLRLVLQDSASVVNFLRTDLYDGSRSELREQLKIPFHIGNYLDGNVGPEVRLSYYNLYDDRDFGTDPLTGERGIVHLDSSSSRALPSFTARVGSTLEQVFEAGSWNPLKTLAELGEAGRHGELVRLKHTLEPSLRYRFVPYVDQSDNPLFDANDQLPKRNVITYSLTQRLFGRFEGRDEYLYGIEEATPEVTDFGPLGSRAPIEDAFNFGLPSADSGEYGGRRRGMRRELMNLRITQSFDIEEDRSWTEDERFTGDETTPFSDVGILSYILPNEYLRFVAGTNISPDEVDFDSYTLGAQLLDKRGDQLRSRITFIDGVSPLRQIETSAEIRLTERVIFGYYSRYDDVTSDFIEQKAGFRFKSSCRCWVLDLNVWDRLNPNETKFMFNLTLVGLGEFGNTLFSQQRTAPGT